MSNLKNQLIKLGSENPDLQKHLRPILDSISSQRRVSKNYNMSEGEIDRTVEEAMDLAKDIGARGVADALDSAITSAKGAFSSGWGNTGVPEKLSDAHIQAKQHWGFNRDDKDANKLKDMIKDAWESAKNL